MITKPKGECRPTRLHATRLRYAQNCQFGAKSYTPSWGAMPSARLITSRFRQSASSSWGHRSNFSPRRARVSDRLRSAPSTGCVRAATKPRGTRSPKADQKGRGRCRQGGSGSPTGLGPAGLIAVLRLFRRPYRVEHDLRIGGLCQCLCHFVAVIALVGVVAAKFF
jgi:hypothetical protein